MHKTDPDDLIGSAEACTILRIDRSAFTRKVQMGRVPVAAKLPGPTGAYLFRRADIERLLQDLKPAS